MKLYELRENYQTIQAMLDEQDDFTNESLIDTLASIEDAIQIKAENIAKMLIHFQKEAEAIKQEETRLAGRRKSLENRASSMKQYLLSELDQAGLTKVKGELLTVSRQNSTPSVFIEEAGALPTEFIQIKIETVIDKKAIMDALKQGQEVPGARINIGQHIRIR